MSPPAASQPGNGASVPTPGQPATGQPVLGQGAPGQPAAAQPGQGAAQEPATPAYILATGDVPIQTATEEQIRDAVSTGLAVYRLAANPDIVVLDFASLREQGLMLNRVAALIEKGAMPRNRVLDDQELDAAIRAGGDTIETFYYGHDYGADSLRRFFALAMQDGIRLNPEELALRRLLAQLGWLASEAHGGLISLPRVGANAAVTPQARTSILRHELSHGEYFSNPAYAAYVHRFWQVHLTAAERDGVRRFLGSEEYDPTVEELVENEMQAYLMFTRDPVFFTPAQIGMSPERLATLQRSFHRDMPHGWLRDLLEQTLETRSTAPR
jgi:hypothetical protein